MVAHAKVSGLTEVMINTNGTLLDRNLSREIVRAGVDRIIFSIDSIDPKKFARLRPRRSRSNSRELGNPRELQGRRGHPHITGARTVSKSTDHGPQGVYRLLARAGRNGQLLRNHRFP
jgi:MoaA/NifB/PqqE/SkfB family radical SAM enzyme